MQYEGIFLAAIVNCKEILMIFIMGFISQDYKVLECFCFAEVNTGSINLFSFSF